MVRILEVKSVQTSVFKTLIEALKEILSETNIEFNELGMKIVATDEISTILVHLKLRADKFEYYHCEGKQVIGVDLLKLFKLIKTMSNNDTFTLYIDSDNINELGIIMEDGEKSEITTFTLNLIDLNQTEISIPPAEFDSIMSMPSVDFQNICRKMSQVSGKKVEIKSINDEYRIRCEGDDARVEVVRTPADSGMKFMQDNKPDIVTQGFYKLKDLIAFTKCTSLSQNIELYFKNDYPLIICYTVASLGELRLCLVPSSDS
jgi:proliferating cell nuclear antigen